MREIAREIIESAANGDMNAFEEIYKTFSSTVYTVAMGITGHAQDAEEAAQEVFIKVFRGLKYFKFNSSFGTWLYRITMNTAINIYRSRVRRGGETVNYDEAKVCSSAAPDLSKEARDRDHAVRLVSVLLKNISPNHRSCIVLREIEGLDYKEISAVLKIPLNTVRSRIKRGREAMIAYSRKEGISYEL